MFLEILYLIVYVFMFFFFKQKTAYEMRISDWSSDVCSSDLLARPHRLRDMFQIDLVADAGARGDRLEIVERLRSPFQKVIAFAVAIIFDQIGRASCRERVCQYV